MTDDQFVGFSFLAGMVAVPFVGPWVEQLWRRVTRPYNTDRYTAQRMADEVKRREQRGWDD